MSKAKRRDQHFDPINRGVRAKKQNAYRQTKQSDLLTRCRIQRENKPST